MIERSLEIDVPSQDYIVLAGRRSPGFAEVRGCGSPRSWDVQQGYGFTGAVAIFTGEGLAKFEVDIYAWEPAHFVAWKEWAKATLAPPTPKNRSTSMAIEHPLLNDPPLTITQVVVEDVSQWEQDPDGGGLWCRTVKFMQFRPRKPVLVKPVQGPPPSPLVVKPPQTPGEKMIAELLPQIEALSK